MSDYHTLLHVIRSRICENRSMAQSAYYLGSQQDNQIRNRTALIFTLEMILHQHRIEYATIFNPLEGKAALHHLIFMKTKWKPAEIRELSLEDALFSIQDMLKIESLQEEAKEVLASFGVPSAPFLFDTLPDADWNFRENSVFL